MKNKILNYSGWLVIWSFIVYFIINNVVKYFNPRFGVYTSEFSRFAPSLVLHITCGTVALLIGPFQFVNKIRIKYPHIHRLIGKVYLTCVLIGGLCGAYLSIFDSILTKHQFTFGTGVFFLAVAWFITSGMAFYSILNRNINQHKEWMIRSYIVTNGFIVFRIIYYSLLAFPSFIFRNEVHGVSAWACWSIPLLIAEWILQKKKVIRRRTNTITVQQELSSVSR